MAPAPDDLPRVIEQIERFVAAGRRLWRTHGLDAEWLLSLPAVQAVLPDMDVEGKPSPDQALDAVEEAVKRAIDRLHHPFREAALDQFGFSDSGERPAGKTERDRRAARHFGNKTDRWFREPKRGRPYEGLAPSAWIIREVARALIGEADELSSEGDEFWSGSAGRQPATERIAHRTERRPRVALVCALAGDREHRVLRDRCRGLRARRRLGVVYEEGELDIGSITWDVAVLATGEGNSLANGQTQGLLASFAPDCALFLGCAGGFSEKGLSLGDVVIPKTVHLFQSSAAGPRVQTRPKPALADAVLVRFAELVAYRHWFDSGDGDWHPAVHFKDVASGEVLLRTVSSEVYHFIREHYNQAVAIEMEGYGFLTAAHSMRTPAMIIRGISDLLDDKEEASDAIWQPRAVGAAADFASTLLQEIEDEYSDLASRHATSSREAVSAFANRRPGIEPEPRPGSELSSGGGVRSVDRSAVLRTIGQHIEAAVGWVRRAQNPDGGLPSDDIGSVSCAWTTAGLLWAVSAAGEMFSGLWMRRAVGWLISHTNPDGGIPIVTPGDPSVTDASAQAVLALTSYERERQDDKTRAASTAVLDWLLECQEPAGGWPWLPSRSPSLVATTAFAVCAMNEANTLRGEEDILAESIEAGVGWLVNTRNHDAGWGACRGEMSRPATTGLAMYALAVAGKRTMASESIDYLRSCQQPDGHWSDALDRPGGHTLTRFGDPAAVLGIAAAAQADSLDLLISGLGALLQYYRVDHFQYRDSVMHAWPTRDGLLALTEARSLLNEQGTT